MNVDCEGLRRLFFAFRKGLSAGGQRAEKIAAVTAPLRGSKSVAFTPVDLLLLQPFLILVKLTLEFVPWPVGFPTCVITAIPSNGTAYVDKSRATRRRSVRCAADEAKRGR
jgi:hypothetical protein